MHSNCRSIVDNFNSLLSLINLLNHHISVIAVSELWTNRDNEHFFNIPGYNFVAKSRLHTTGSGVDLFVSETYNFRLRDDLTDTVVESIFIKIVPDNIIIGCVYRKPGSDISLFTAYIHNLLSKVNTERNKCYLAGDFNINLLKHDTHSPIAEFINCVFSYSFSSTINKPTRVTDFSATLIDNIIPKCKCK